MRAKRSNTPASCELGYVEQTSWILFLEYLDDLEKIAGIGFGKEELSAMQKMIEAEECDLFDVLEYVSFARPKITRISRVSSGEDATEHLGGVEMIRSTFLSFQKHLYSVRVA